MTILDQRYRLMGINCLIGEPLPIVRNATDRGWSCPHCGEAAESMVMENEYKPVDPELVGYPAFVHRKLTSSRVQFQPCGHRFQQVVV